MSVHEPPQFTPAQILDAGLRAEGEGRYDFSRQFFRHLIDNYPATAEATAAGQGLERLARAQPQASAPVEGGWPPSPPLGQAPEPFYFEPRSASGGAARSGQGEYGGETEFNGWPQNASPSAVFTTPVAQGRRHGELPPTVHDYRAGRYLARLVTWLGVLQILAGVGLLPIAVVSPRSLTAIPLLGSFAASPMLAAGMAMAGLAQIMLGQLVRAVLDQANATRDLAAIARVQADPRHTFEVKGRRR